MKKKINLTLPNDWTLKEETYKDKADVEVTHLHAALPDDKSIIDVYAARALEGETAEDQILLNYSKTVGFDKVDSRYPITDIQFQGNHAYSFEVELNDYIMLLFTVKLPDDTMLLVSYYVKTEEDIAPTFELIEKNLSVLHSE